jgi:hypothetical protein
MSFYFNFFYIYHSSAFLKEKEEENLQAHSIEFKMDINMQDQIRRFVSLVLLCTFKNMR